jgi:hypothetical protein
MDVMLTMHMSVVDLMLEVGLMSTSQNTRNF